MPFSREENIKTVTAGSLYIRLDVGAFGQTEKRGEKKQKIGTHFLLLAEVQHSGLLALCGPNKVMDESTCECVCQNGLTEHSCDPGWKLDHDTCKRKLLTLQQ